MIDESTVFTADFPRVMRGYSPHAVDDFVRQLGSRLDLMQSKLDEQIVRSDRLAEELGTATRTLGEYRGKESALAGALVAAEQMREAMRKQLEADAKTAHNESQAIIKAAQREAEQILDEARSNASAITESAFAACNTQESRLTTLSAHHDNAVDQIRRTIETLTALLPPPGILLPTSSLESLGDTAVVEPNRPVLQAAA